jgi:hypothetical protein
MNLLSIQKKLNHPEELNALPLDLRLLPKVLAHDTVSDVYKI